jgi:hypothetical protein
MGRGLTEKRAREDKDTDEEVIGEREKEGKKLKRQKGKTIREIRKVNKGISFGDLSSLFNTASSAAPHCVGGCWDLNPGSSQHLHWPVLPTRFSQSSV